MNTFTQVGAALLAGIPAIIIAAIGVYLAFARWAAHPPASLLVSLGLLGLLFNAFGSAALQVWVQGQHVAGEGEIAYGHRLAMFNLGFYGLHLAGLVLDHDGYFFEYHGIGSEDWSDDDSKRLV
jgi:hypothetical protein